MAKTHFQVEGLRPGQLPPELIVQLQQQGIDAADLTFEGTDLERRVTNTGTNDAMVREFMDVSIKDAVGTLPGKTIVFAVSHRHALELYQSFNRLYPDLQRRGLARIIDSHTERAEKTLDDFKHKDLPRVAISVDMLDTGIDVPAIRNLVFAKPVFSQVKFWQMIGRGTRLWTDPVSGQRKEDFLIIDHWDNFAYFQVNPGGKGAGAATEPLPTRLFRLRLEKLQILTGRGEAATVEATRGQLQAVFAPLMRFQARHTSGEMIRLTLPDSIAQRHWTVFGPAGDRWPRSSLVAMDRRKRTRPVALPVVQFPSPISFSAYASSNALRVAAAKNGSTTLQAVDYNFDSAGRLSKVLNGTASATYGYHANSTLIATVGLTNGAGTG